MSREETRHGMSRVIIEENLIKALAERSAKKIRREVCVHCPLRDGVCEVGGPSATSVYGEGHWYVEAIVYQPNRVGERKC